MEKIEMDDFDQRLPQSLALAVIMEKQPSTHPWADFRYDAIGVVVRGETPEEKSVSKIYQDGDIEHHLVTGEPATAIVRLATSEQADLIVMATHGRSGLSRLLMGSVAEAVVRQAACPVLTLRQPS